MLADSPIVFASPRFMLFALLIFVFAAIVTIYRNIAARKVTRGLLLGGMFWLACAVGEPSWHRPSLQSVTVMVDLSPSTRGADYRNREFLNQRIHQLLGDTPFNIVAFAGSNQSIPEASTLPDIPDDQTIFNPPPAGAILLFSDGQFEIPPIAPMTFPVLDKALEHPSDASIDQLEQRGDQFAATIKHSGSPRVITWSGAVGDNTSPIESSIVTIAKATKPGTISAALSPGDLWPENDSLSIQPLPPPSLEFWYVGNRVSPNSWRRFSPAELPSDPATYLDAAVIVLDNVSAESMGTVQQQRLAQYVRDLGGGLVIVGGDHAFAAGHYFTSVLDAISPLASLPPEPTTHWMVLVDGSGSMADSIAGSQTKWQSEVDAVTRLLPALPPNDLVSVGSFAESLTWWFQSQSADKAVAVSFPPVHIRPNGPTNLEPALQQLIHESAGSMPTQLLVMTDAGTELNDVESIANELKSKLIHLHVLAMGNGRALDDLSTIARTTGGSVIQQFDPKQWSTAMRQLMQTALPDRLSHDPITIVFKNELSSLGNRSSNLWNRVWPRPGIETLAENGPTPMAGKWQVGSGQAAAIAYAATMDDVAKIAQLIAIPPRDPRFHITCQTGDLFRVDVDAIDNGSYVNGLRLQMDLKNGRTGDSKLNDIPQTAPGHYELIMPAPRETSMATVRAGLQVLQRSWIAGRYAPEFDAIGNNRATLSALAQITGGEVIDSQRVNLINFKWPARTVSLLPAITLLGSALIAMGLIRWRRRGV